MRERIKEAWKRLLEVDASARNLAPSAPGKDRYFRLTPFTHNTIRLASGEYINASPITIPCGQPFIATQAPLQSTMPEFWAMVIEYNVPVIVTLGNVVDDKITKMYDYWSQIGKIVNRQNGWIERDLVIPSSTGALTVRHIHNFSWPDHGVPASMKEFQELLTTVEELATKQRPVIVHCSAGVGRTGTFIASFEMLQHLRASKGKPEDPVPYIENLVKSLKEQRQHSVESLAQFQFLFYCYTGLEY